MGGKKGTPPYAKYMLMFEQVEDEIAGMRFTSTDCA